MADQIDLTLDSDDEDLQKAIKASLSETGKGGSGSTFSASCANSNDEVGRTSPASTAAVASKSKRRSDASSAVGDRQTSAKRPRSSGTSATPPLFRLLSTSPTDSARTGSVDLEDLLSGSFSSALFSNYMIDMGLLVNAQPRLRSVPVVVVHGDQPGGENEMALRSQCAAINPGIKLHRPKTAQYGTQHAKMIILKFPAGVRVVVLTANFVSTDVRGKSQGVWYQEFPLRQAESCDFEESLVGYLDHVGGPAADFGRSLRHFDFRAARVALVPTVPGTGKNRHKGPHLHKYGHMRVRELLSRENRAGGGAKRLKEGGHKVIFQFSSLASLTKNPNAWLSELLASFMPSTSNQKQEAVGSRRGAAAAAASTGADNSAQAKLLEDRLRLVWPSVEAVRNSTEGWQSGGAICCSTMNMFGGHFTRPDMDSYRSNTPRPELKPLLCKWQGNPLTERVRDAPHIKSYLCYREVQVPGKYGTEARIDEDQAAWFLLTSSNLSQSAWGLLDKTSTELTLKSFEMGVMFLPSLLDRPSCTSGGGASMDEDADALAFTCTPGEMGLTQRFPLTLQYQCQPGKALPLDLLPLPYVVPAPSYNFEKSQDNRERPWVWDRPMSQLDHRGESWGSVNSS
ncbi:unnamed protein product [Scytosiphon promiscuus]